MKKEKIVLAYSGGLDTSIIIPWLKEKYQAEVIAYTADLGQVGNVKTLQEKALSSGATKFCCENLQEEFVKDYILPALFANSLYQGKYPLATALSRYIIAQKMAQLAKRERATALAHGCSGKGNDQIRFELAWSALSPELKVIAPLREWKFKTREEEIDYAQKKKVMVSVSRQKPYSIDSNLWGTAIECGLLEEPYAEPPEDAFQLTVSPENAPDKKRYIEIEFKEGIPVKIDGEREEPLNLIALLNQIGGENGVGRIDLIEDRAIGIKSREVYEAPAATILISSHQDLERLVLDRETINLKEVLSQRYSQLIYNGYWFSPLRESLSAFFKDTQKYVSGTVRLKLYKGSCVVVGRKSPLSLYRKELATYSEKDIFDQKDATAFLKILKLSIPNKRQ